MAFHPTRRLLPPPDGFVESVVICSVGAIQTKLVEQAGHKHHTLWLARFYKASGTSGKKKKSRAVEEKEEEPPLTKEEYARMVALMGDGPNAAQDHYALLGLAESNINAGEEAIRRSYRKLILRYHPDKVGGAKDAAADPLFLAIQRAYDVLSDPAKRRVFDSQFEFDDSIPEANEKGDFFAVFGPVFERNARFSEDRPVPQLRTPGRDGEQEEDAAVLEFYRFWENFRSWRDFSGEGEHSVDDAESREEKRWMERQNAAAIAKMREKEVIRIRTLVARSRARDPRIAAMKAAEEERKKAAWEAKQAGKKGKENAVALAAAEKAAAEEAARVEAAARKMAREKEKKQAKLAEKNIRRMLGEAVAAAAAAGGAPLLLPSEAALVLLFSQPSVATVAAAAAATASGSGTPTAAAPRSGSSTPTPVAAPPPDAATLLALADTVAKRLAGEAAPGGPEGVVAAVAAAVAHAQARDVEEKAGGGAASPTPGAAAGGFSASAAKPAAAPAAAPVPHGPAPWSVLETSMLAKAVSRFPPGTRNRWGMICDYVNAHGGSVGAGGVLVHPQRSQDECVAKANRVGEEEKKQASKQSFQVYTQTLANKGKDTEVKDSDAVAGAPTLGSISITLPPGAEAPPAAAAVNVPDSAESHPDGASSASADMGEWSPEEQGALEASLRRHPATLDKAERWALIAVDVGKTKKQVMARFKFLREQVMAVGGAAAAPVGGAPIKAGGR